MIGFLRGIVHYFDASSVLLDVNNVGYRIFFFHPENLRVNEEVLIYTYENIREDEQSLYGFLTLDEYDLFVKLISVKGLGPKIASGILAKSSPDKIVEAIENSDLAFIRSMPGVGNKVASQIILDLKGKLVANPVEVVDESKMKDVRAALISLGYKAGEIKPVLAKIAQEDLSTDGYIKKALAMLMK